MGVNGGDTSERCTIERLEQENAYLRRTIEKLTTYRIRQENLADNHRALLKRINAENAELFASIAAKNTELEHLNSELTRALQHQEQANQALAVEVAERLAAEEAWRKAHSQLQGILDYSDSLIILFDRQSRLLLVNASFAKLFGQTESALLGKTAADLLNTSTAANTVRHVEQVFATGQSVYFELDITIAGRRRVFHMIHFPLFDHEGSITTACGIATEMTEIKRLQEEAIHTARLASIGELAAGVAHEINNPVNGIMAYAELLDHGAGPALLLQSAPAKIIAECNRVATIVRSLLDFSRGSSDTFKPLDIIALLKDGLALNRSLLDNSRITVELELPAASPRLVADGQGIRQVLLNLIANARQALELAEPEKDRRLGIAVRAEERSGIPGVTVCFRDSGPGMEAETIERVFEPFFTTKPAGKGTGLGLPLSLRIVRQHRGSIDICSTVGSHTEVVIWLPSDSTLMK